MSVSLGVGGSTIAIVNFFVAIHDGTIEPTERRIMGVTYGVLRVAMATIFITSLTLGLKAYGMAGDVYFTSHIVAFWIVLSVIFLNAVLMTKQIMPSTVGPALQATSWYTLGVLMTIFSLGLSSFTLLQFLLGYMTAIFLAISLVNGLMAVFKSMKEEKVA